MEPRYDPVCLLLETPFVRWKEDDKRQLLKEDRPIPKLSIHKKKTVHLSIVVAFSHHGMYCSRGYVAAFIYKNCFVGRV